MPHPDSWFIEWLAAQSLLSRDIIVEYQRKRDLAVSNRASFDAPMPTLGGLLEQDGLLTKAQREAGEKEAARRQGDFAAWRSRTMEEQERKRRPPSGPG